ncbi:MAG TPA: hypothetical protein VIX20_10135 [Ktedonobacteraceae bacterium]
MPSDIWEAWEDYIGDYSPRLRYIWHRDRGYYSPGFRRFVDLKVGTAPLSTFR